MSINWTKRPTYEEILADLDQDCKVKLPNRVAVNFYDSFAHTQFQQMQSQISTSQANVDSARDHAMSMAADDSDTSKHAIFQAAAPMQQQISAASQETQRLNSQMAETHERSRQQQAEEMAKLIAHQQIERDNGDRVYQKIIEDLKIIKKLPQRQFHHRHQLTRPLFKMRCARPQLPFEAKPSQNAID